MKSLSRELWGGESSFLPLKSWTGQILHRANLGKDENSLEKKWSDFVYIHHTSKGNWRRGVASREIEDTEWKDFGKWCNVGCEEVKNNPNILA